MYARTIAAFANTKGGYLVFGVEDKPRRVIGLQGDDFENLDPADVANFLNQRFMPEIDFDQHIHEIANQSIGLLYIHESSGKPVVCSANCGKEVKEGDIMYRYRGRTQRIRYPELREMLNYRQEQERKQWLRLFKSAAKFGVQNSALLDLKTGELNGGSRSAKLIINEELLGKVKFVLEGRFVETGGDPTLRLVGDIESSAVVVNPGKKATRSVYKSITEHEIICQFLKSESPDIPMEYLKQACNENTKFLPIFHYLSKLTTNIDEVIGKLNQIRGNRKDRVTQLLKNGFGSLGMQLGEISKSEAAQERNRFYRLLRDKKLENSDLSDNKSIKRFCEAIRCSQDWAGYETRLKANLLHCYESKVYELEAPVKEAVRKAIAYLSWLEHSVRYRNKPSALP